MKAIPGAPERYPERFEWDEQAETLSVGDGEIGPVTRKVWEHSVSGLEVVKSWLGYRMRQPSGKKSSPLDEILAERWTAEMTEELLRFLWILEHTIELQPELAALLEEVTAGETFTADELPQPSAAENEAPTLGKRPSSARIVERIRWAAARSACAVLRRQRSCLRPGGRRGRVDGL